MPRRKDGSTITKACKFCGTEFQAHQSNALYCSHRCRVNQFNASKPGARERNREKSAAWKALRRDDPEAFRQYYWSNNLKSRHGLTPEQFYEILDEQGGRCAICRSGVARRDNEDMRMHIDHDHSCCRQGRSCASCRRGLLCNSCNRGLGQFADDPARLDAAAAYLRKYQ